MDTALKRILGEEIQNKDMQRIKLDQMRIDISNELAFEENEQHNVPPCLGSIQNPLYFSHSQSNNHSHSVHLQLSSSSSSSPGRINTHQKPSDTSSLCSFQTAMVKFKTSIPALTPQAHHLFGSNLNNSQLNKSLSKISEYNKPESSVKVGKLNWIKDFDEESKHKERDNKSAVEIEDIELKDISNDFHQFNGYRAKKREFNEEVEQIPEFNVKDENDEQTDNKSKRI